MVFSLKKAAKNVFGIGGEEMDRIAELPMTQMRLELKNAFQDKKFDAPMFDAFVEKLLKFDGGLKDQIEIVKGAIANGEVESELDIEVNTPAKQLLWAAALTRMMDDAEEGPLAQKRIWKQLQDTMGVYNESIRISKMLSLSMQNDDVTYSWGQPGTWFYQDPIKNHLNFDLYFMLLSGFEYVRAVEGHEIGHSQLSTDYPPRMKELYEKVKQFIDPRTVDKDNSAPPPQMGKKDQIALAGEVAEWQLWHRAWNGMEDLTVDQFAIDLTRLIREQDFGDSMNHAAMVLRGYGEILRGDDLNKPIQITTDLPDKDDPIGKMIPDILRKRAEKEIQDKKDELEKRRKHMTSPLTPADIKDINNGKISLEVAEKMYEEITRASLLSGYVKNGLFTDKEDNWERFRVYKGDINKTVDMSKVPDANGRDAFTYLCDLCSEGPDSIRLTQPQPQDRMLERNGKTVKESYKEVVAETTKKRGETMQKIWDLLIKPYADVLIEEFKQQTKKNLDQKNQQGQGNQKGNQQGQGQGQGQSQGQGQGQPGQGQGQGQGQGEPQGGGGGTPDMSKGMQPGEGGGQGDQSGGGKDQKDQKDQKGGGGQGDKQEKGDKSDDKNQSGGGGEEEDNTPQDMDETLKDQVGNMAENPHEKEAKDQAENKKDGKGNDGKDPQDGKDGAGKDGKPEGQDGQEGQDGKPEPKPGKDKDGKGGPGWGQDQNQQSQPIKVGDMKNKSVAKEELSKEEKEAMKEAAKNMPKVDPNAMTSQAGNQRGVDLAALAKGDYKDFHRRCLELAPIINMRRAAWKKIKEQQRRQYLQKSKRHDYLPPDGDIQDRLDVDKVLEAKFKKATKQKMTSDDAKKFQDDDIFTTESAIKSIGMIDGSGSMTTINLGSGVSAMDVAMQAAVIDYMAARLEGIPSWIVMWGDSVPIIVASPDMPLKKVGENVETYRNGTNSGTSLRPGLIKMVETAADFKTPPGTISGSLHIQVYSDGDIGDYKPTTGALRTIAKNAKHMSVDVAVLKQASAPHTQMEEAFEEVIKDGGARYIGVTRGSNPQEVALELGRQQLRRVRSFNVKPEPDDEQRRRLQQLKRKLDATTGYE